MTGRRRAGWWQCKDQAPGVQMTATFEGVSIGQMANAIRALAMDAVQAANSGHPGMPMGMADVATTLFTQYIKFDPQVPNWP
ncbi:MAG: hypothetical protein RLZZ58_2271, partial [Pseudomonadota bacterium]